MSETEKRSATDVVRLDPVRCFGGREIRVHRTIRTRVEWFCSHFRVLAYSGYRTAQENAAAGGVAHSDHLCGAAVDFVGPYLLVKAAHLFAIMQVRRKKFAFAEFTWTKTNRHLHVSYFRCTR